MHRQESLSSQVYQKLYRFPIRNQEPMSWREHVKDNLMPEVMLELHAYFEHEQHLDKKFPGLDYGYPPHRRRLARRPHHKRLFAAFDDLGLTHSEIRDLCTWKFTLYDKLRAERERGAVILDRTGEEIPTWEADQERRRDEAAEVYLRGGIDGNSQTPTQEEQNKDEEDDTPMDEEEDDQDDLNDVQQVHQHSEAVTGREQVMEVEEMRQSLLIRARNEGERLQALQQLLRTVPMEHLASVEETLLGLIQSSRHRTRTTATTF